MAASTQRRTHRCCLVRTPLLWRSIVKRQRRRMAYRMDGIRHAAYRQTYQYSMRASLRSLYAAVGAHRCALPSALRTTTATPRLLFAPTGTHACTPHRARTYAISPPLLRAAARCTPAPYTRAAAHRLRKRAGKDCITRRQIHRWRMFISATSAPARVRMAPRVAYAHNNELAALYATLSPPLEYTHAARCLHHYLQHWPFTTTRLRTRTHRATSLHATLTLAWRGVGGVIVA